MAYTPYATADDYNKLNLTIIDDVAGALKSASRHIDSLTFNRIVARGFDNLTEFQKEIIKEVCCCMAEFESTNADMLSSMIDSYTLNGVSVTYNSGDMVRIIGGIPIRQVHYELLAQTGLTTRLVIR